MAAKNVPPAPSPVLTRSLQALRDQGVPFRKLADLRRREGNPRDNAEAVPAIVRSLQTFGWTTPMLVDPRGELEAGDTRYLAALHLGLDEVPVIATEHDERTAKLYVPADNRLGEIAQWAPFKLADLFKDYTPAEIRLTGWNPADVQALLAGAAPPEGENPLGARRTLAERFGVPPFSVLDARQGYWQARKRAWLSIGIRSEVGREDDLAFDLPEWAIVNETNTSVFDPVLTELLVRWFAPVGGRIIDPFAGGSVRGVVSAWLGRTYVGVDLRKEQVEANRDQAARLCAGGPSLAASPGVVARAVADWPEGRETPIVAGTVHVGGERTVEVLVKRDDLFAVAGVRGGKVRTCWALAQGATGLVTAGSRASPQVNIVAHIARRLGIPCRVHTPRGKLSPEVEMARRAGAEVVQHPGGYNNVIVARAREDAKERGWVEIPFGMECDEAVAQTRRSVPAKLPPGVERIVVPVGSGMSLAGILHGLRDHGHTVPVLGVVVGADPSKRLDHYAPQGWREQVTLVPSGSDYHRAAEAHLMVGAERVVLDPHYEAKAAPVLRPGDLFWIVGVRQTVADVEVAAPAEKEAPATMPVPTWHEGDSQHIRAILGPDAAPFDFLMTCPPYADLEVYSDDPRDLSTMAYGEFVTAYERIIAESVALLGPDAFAAVVVGEVRGSTRSGAYRGFVPDTIRAFEKAGMAYYNEAILVTAVGSLPVRTAGTFTATRKLGKTHQNVLVFVRGDVAKVVARLEATPAWEALPTAAAEPVLP